MTEQDRAEFVSYLRACTDSQVQGVYDKEKAAGRKDFAELANAELKQRNLK